MEKNNTINVEDIKIEEIPPNDFTGDYFHRLKKLMNEQNDICTRYDKIFVGIMEVNNQLLKEHNNFIQEHNKLIQEQNFLIKNNNSLIELLIKKQ